MCAISQIKDRVGLKMPKGQYPRNIRNITGETYNKLKAIEYVRCDKRDKAIWKFQCECGNIVERKSVSVRTGKIKSCGCLIKEIQKYSGPKNVLCGYKIKCRKKNIEFNITLEQAKIIFSQNCHYCNSKPKNKHHPKNKIKPYYYNGIDRINNKLGYLENNIVPCCIQCNKAKGTLTYEQFLQWIVTVYNFTKTNLN